MSAPFPPWPARAHLLTDRPLPPVSLGLDESDSTKQNLEVYRTDFEAIFLQATELYYKAESDAFVAENSVVDYMKKAETRLKEEEDRIELYLHPSTRVKVS